jgi:hypothetical protein
VHLGKNDSYAKWVGAPEMSDVKSTAKFKPLWMTTNFFHSLHSQA